MAEFGVDLRPRIDPGCRDIVIDTRAPAPCCVRSSPRRLRLASRRLAAAARADGTRGRGRAGPVRFGVRFAPSTILYFSVDSKKERGNLAKNTCFCGRMALRTPISFFREPTSPALVLLCCEQMQYARHQDRRESAPRHCCFYLKVRKWCAPPGRHRPPSASFSHSRPARGSFTPRASRRLTAAGTTRSLGTICGTACCSWVCCGSTGRCGAAVPAGASRSATCLCF